MSLDDGAKEATLSYRFYLSHRLGSIGSGLGGICDCRSVRTCLVTSSQHQLALRQAIAKQAACLVAEHHALPASSFSIAIDRAILLYRNHISDSDQHLPGINLRSEEDCAHIGDAIAFWRQSRQPVPVWIEFHVKMATVDTRDGPRGNEIVIHQALANEEAEILQKRKHYQAGHDASTDTETEGDDGLDC